MCHITMETTCITILLKPHAPCYYGNNMCHISMETTCIAVLLKPHVSRYHGNDVFVEDPTVEVREFEVDHKVEETFTEGCDEDFKLST